MKLLIKMVQYGFVIMCIPLDFSRLFGFFIKCIYFPTISIYTSRLDIHRMPIMPFLRSPSILLLYRVLLFPGYKISSLTCHAMGKMIIYRVHEELKKKSMYSSSIHKTPNSPKPRLGMLCMLLLYIKQPAMITCSMCM